jgi:aminomuconate-semialdehyde/2-hydroxymuconate-6-semialdehyde dehydrogenase
MLHILNYIQGDLLAPANTQYLDNIEPALGKTYSYIADSDTDDVELAVKAAREAFPAWSSMKAAERSHYLLKIADKIEEHLDKLAEAEARDSGKPLSLAKRMDIPRAASNFRFFATAILHQQNECYPTDQVALNYVLRQPVGVVGCISPWNLPLYLFTWKIAPALAAGCTVVAKPSELTPLTAFMLAQICQEVGLPKGVLNIVQGLGSKVGNAIVSHPQIKAISFTGGTQTGKIIASIAAPMFKKLSLELGGKNPNIVFADCDFEKAVTTSVASAFTNQGQICLCGSRIFVEKSIYNTFKEAFVEKVKKLSIGNPFEENTQIGAVVSAQHYQKVLSYIQLAQEEGGKILCGGHPVKLTGINEHGYFIAPTVIEGLDVYCRTNQEEIFGAVVTLQAFENVEEVIKWANSTQYGLAATIWTQNLNKAHNVAANLEAGIVWVNTWLMRDLRTPFGGVKNSGVGREGGWEALHFFTETKNVCIGF